MQIYTSFTSHLSLKDIFRTTFNISSRFSPLSEEQHRSHFTPQTGPRSKLISEIGTHPPTCPYPEVNGRSLVQFKGHVAAHKE